MPKPEHVAAQARAKWSLRIVIAFDAPVSYTHQDVYKRQVLDAPLSVTLREPPG